MPNAVEIVIKALDQTRGGITSAAKNIATIQGTILGLGATAAAIGTAWAGAMSLLVKHSIEAASELGSLSKQTGINVEDLSRISFAARASGVDLESFTTIVNHANRSIAEAAGNNSSDAAKALRALGISATDSSGNLIRANQLIIQLSEAFSQYADGPNKVAISMALLGRSGAETINFLDKGASKIRELGNSISVVTSDEASQAKNFKEVFKTLNTEILNFGNDLTKEVLPPIAALSKELTAFIKESGARQAAIDGLKSSFEKLAVAAQQANLAMSIKQKGADAVIAESVFGFLKKTADGMADAQSKAEGLKDTLSSSGEKKDAPGIFNEDNLRKASEMANKMRHDLTTGADRMAADLSAQHVQRLKEIDELSVAESEKDNLRKQSKQLMFDLETRQTTEGLRFRANAEDAFNAGSIQKTMQLFESKKAIAQADLLNNQAFIDVYTEQWRIASQNITGFAASMFGAFSQNFGNAIGEVLRDFSSAADAVKKFGQAMLNSVTNFIGQWIAAKITMMAMELVFGRTVAAATVGTALTIGAAWAAPAALASLATLGSNSAAANAALAGTVAFSKGLAVVGGVAHGGMDYVPQESTYLLDKGERVLSPNQNAQLMEFLNGQGGGANVVEVHLDGEVLGRGIGRLSRDGRMVLSASAIA